MNDGGRMFPESQPISVGTFIHVRPALYKILKKFQLRNFKGVGSTNRAPLMGDIDLVAESDLKRDDVFDLMLTQLGEGNVKKSGSSMICFMFEGTQVDLIIGDRKYVDWARAGCSYKNGRGLLKGAFRNLLFNATLRVLSTKMFPSSDPLERERYTLDFDTGMYFVKQTKKGVKGELKDWKTVERKLFSRVPNKIVRFIFDEPTWQARYVRSFEELVPLIKKSKRTKEHAKEIFEEFLKDVNSIDKSVKMFGRYPDLVMDLIHDVIENKVV